MDSSDKVCRSCSQDNVVVEKVYDTIGSTFTKNQNEIKEDSFSRKNINHGLLQ